MSISVKELPKLKKNRHPERITLAISCETKRRLDELKLNRVVDTPALLRKMIEDFLNSVTT